MNTAPTPEKPSRLYVETRQCTACNHIGMNDACSQRSVCTACPWCGDTPETDRCPACGAADAMRAACPKCGEPYVVIAEAVLGIDWAATMPASCESTVARDQPSNAWIDATANFHLGISQDEAFARSDERRRAFARECFAALSGKRPAGNLMHAECIGILRSFHAAEALRAKRQRRPAAERMHEHLLAQVDRITACLAPDVGAPMPKLTDAQRKDLLMAALYLSADEGISVLTSSDATRVVQTLFDVGGLHDLVAAAEAPRPLTSKVSGLIALKRVVAALRSDGRFIDEEGEDTDALEDLIAAVDAKQTTLPGGEPAYTQGRKDEKEAWLSACGWDVAPAAAVSPCDLGCNGCEGCIEDYPLETGEGDAR